ncbi:hypothetical protein DPMN_037036 [Dreissena polymorpha]|uniref:Uncharacterized protein n=1 Tax=Dreissena polymorpha TaxID=45954 RepID=A0A9D4RLZ5_DREPO|nr:hypothetical protein DPMN_037036 [Dreissena polymorpha]
MLTDGRTYDGQRSVTKAHLSNQYVQYLRLAQTNQPTDQPTNRPTNQQTNRQGKNNMSPTTIFHDDWAKNVIFRVHVIQLTGTIFELNSHIKETNVLTKFHENWAKNVTSRTIFELVRDINKTNVLTNFHDDWANIVTSRVFTRKTAPPPPGSHVIQLTGTIFELNSHIKETNKNAPPTGSHVFSPIWTIFELVRDINKTNVLTNFHDDWTKIVISRVFTRKTAPPTGGHIGHEIFELDRDIIGTNLLTKFHEDPT